MARRGGDLPGDIDLWRQVAKSVTPLRKRRRLAAKPQLPAKPEPEVVPTRATRAKVTPAVPPAQPSKPVLPELSPRRTAGQTVPGLDARNAQRLARGQLTIEARLDLHGLTQSEAHDRLVGFIRASLTRERRCVLVITGKGYKPSGESGVLRHAVPRWLNAPDLRPHVLAIRHAQPKDGGEGALYVLLKRKRAS